MNRRAKIFNLPNLITGSRFLLSGFLMVLLLLEQTPRTALIAFWVFVVAAGSDWIDGYFARRYKSVTVLGKLMDPLADKVLVTTALVMLIPTGWVPAWLALIILCREIVVTGLRGVASSAGIVVAASHLIARHPDPTRAQIADALNNHVCRCTGYVSIMKAALDAAERLRALARETADA